MRIARLLFAALLLAVPASAFAATDDEPHLRFRVADLLADLGFGDGLHLHENEGTDLLGAEPAVATTVERGAPASSSS
jgi:hypothetical protein